MSDTVGDDAQRERRRLVPDLRLGGAVSEHARQIGRFADPPSVLFAFNFDPLA
ncbi:MAG TPA: hypothetical protein VFC56_16465 [Stellaceae bacterium]|nr:hypothetical protein [Stellaceae bacterium]